MATSRHGAWRKATDSTTPASGSAFSPPRTRRGSISERSRFKAASGSPAGGGGAGERGGVAEGGEQAADIGHEEDEEDHGVGDPPALPVGLEQGPDQYHRGPRGPDDRGQDRSRREEGRVGQRGRLA